MRGKVIQFPARDRAKPSFELTDEKWEWILPIEIRYVDALFLVSQLALALKHPENDGQAAAAARFLGKNLAERLMQDIPEFTMKIAGMLGWAETFELK